MAADDRDMLDQVLKKQIQGRRNARQGVAAENAACAALEREGWHILGRRLRTAAGEVDAVAEKAGLLSFIEVKSRACLARAAASLGVAQQRRLMLAAEILLGDNPHWGQNGVRFDVLVLDRAGRIRRITDAFRQEACAV
jgi:putative endonuclease